jgi:hypothetical protein
VLDLLPARVGNGAPTELRMIMPTPEGCPAEKCTRARSAEPGFRPLTTAHAILTRSHHYGAMLLFKEPEISSMAP